MSAAADGSDDTAVNSIALKLVCIGLYWQEYNKMSSTLKILTARLIEIIYFKEIYD